jgi:hypothetical protein
MVVRCSTYVLVLYAASCTLEGRQALEVALGQQAQSWVDLSLEQATDRVMGLSEGRSESMM